MVAASGEERGNEKELMPVVVMDVLSAALPTGAVLPPHSMTPFVWGSRHVHLYVVHVAAGQDSELAG